jgi:hypothetical protein
MDFSEGLTSPVLADAFPPVAWRHTFPVWKRTSEGVRIFEAQQISCFVQTHVSFVMEAGLQIRTGKDWAYSTAAKVLRAKQIVTIGRCTTQGAS